ncbi:MAG: TlpA family protein disulfide reductase [Alphaproteobacteria bacterium]|nr:TlpA family protein disulfide reductase [Alphaproteobacteria bacterium]
MKRILLLIFLAAVPLIQVGEASAGELKPFVRDSWRSILDAHARRAFIVHFWGLTCAPCRVELPEWGKLLAERPDLPLVTVNADIVQDSSSDAEEFLAKSGLQNAENWIFNDKFAERLRYEIDPKWQGELPVTLLVAPDGSIDKIEGPATMSEISAWLIKQQEPAKKIP